MIVLNLKKCDLGWVKLYLKKFLFEIRYLVMFNLSHPIQFSKIKIEKIEKKKK
jgi:hypothetical protein